MRRFLLTLLLSGIYTGYVVFSVDVPTVRPAAWARPIALSGVPNLHRVSANLYRSAQPTAEGMTNLVALGVKTVLNLRNFHSDEDEIGGLALAAQRIPINTWSIDSEDARKFLGVMADTNALPVLVHCQHFDGFASREQTIAKLKVETPNLQICFRTEAALKTLTFMGSKAT